MKEYFIVANSFAAPFFSDSSTAFVNADSPNDAFVRFASEYNHPCGLYAAEAYESSDDYHKRKPSKAKWLSNEAVFMQEHGMDGWIRNHGNGKIEISGKVHIVVNPKKGKVVTPD